MIILDCEQGSDEWKEARRGIPTSSNFDKIVTSTGKLSSQSTGYMNKLLSDYIEPSNDNSFSSPSMQEGNDREPESRALYELITGHTVTEVGGIWLDDNKDILCSPDGLITDIGRGLEMKNPDLHTHIGYYRAGVLPTKYIIQVQSGMMHTGYEEWDFMSHHPKYMPFIITVKRNEALITKIRESVQHFNYQLKHEKSIFDDWKKSEF